MSSLHDKIFDKNCKKLKKVTLNHPAEAYAAGSRNFKREFCDFRKKSDFAQKESNAEYRHKARAYDIESIGFSVFSPGEAKCYGIELQEYQDTGKDIVD